MNIVILETTNYKSYVYRLYPNKQQARQICQTIGSCRFVYNKALEWREKAYKADGTSLSYNDTANAITQMKRYKETAWLKEADAAALQQSLMALDQAFKNYWNKDLRARRPKYKSVKRSRKSYKTPCLNKNIRVTVASIKLPKLGYVKAVIHREPDKDWIIKSATIVQNPDGSFEASVLYELPTMEIAQKTITEENTIGLDYKSDGLYMDSDGNCCEMPHYFRHGAERLARRQRKLKNKTVGSKNWEKQRTKIAKWHHHIANQRKDFLHKESTAIAKRYTCVCVETLNMRALANKSFGNGKATLDNGYGLFLQMLTYKLQARGGLLIRIDKLYPSSQICWNCGEVHPEMKDLSLRKIHCSCGYTEDRDFNAAKNIKVKGLNPYWPLSVFRRAGTARW